MHLFRVRESRVSSWFSINIKLKLIFFLIQKYWDYLLPLPCKDSVRCHFFSFTWCKAEGVFCSSSRLIPYTYTQIPLTPPCLSKLRSVSPPELQCLILLLKTKLTWRKNTKKIGIYLKQTAVEKANKQLLSHSSFSKGYNPARV